MSTASTRQGLRRRPRRWLALWRARAAAWRDQPLACAPLALGCAVAIGLAGCSSTFEPISSDFLEGDIRLTQLAQLSDPITAEAWSVDDIPVVVAQAEADLRRQLNRSGAGDVEGPQIPFFFESEIGWAYLASGEGRALARGAPAQSCPALGVAVNRGTAAEAAQAALELCLTARTPQRPVGDQADARCGCRLLASGPALLAPLESFAYARGVTARLIDPAGGVDAPLIAVEVHDQASSLDALATGARRLALRAPQGPLATLTLEADGRARLTLADDEDRRAQAASEAASEAASDPASDPRTEAAAASDAPFEGVWASEGFRRGRLARLIRLERADGRVLLVLLGYEPNELEARREALTTAALALEPRPLN